MVRTNKIQRRIPPSYPFPCNVTKSKENTTSVHRLRPSDIKVIGAIGDSIVAANGALGAMYPFANIFEYTGVSFAGGKIYFLISVIHYPFEM